MADKITDKEALNKVAEELKAKADQGKIEMDKVDEVIKSIEFNDKEAEKNGENKTQEELNKTLQGLNENLGKWNDKLTSQENGETQNVITPDKWYMNVLDKDELNKLAVGEEKKNKARYNAVAMERFINAMYRQFKGGMSEQDAKYLNALNSTLSGAAGGYLLPIPTLQLIYDELSESGLFFSETTIIDFADGQGKKKNIPTLAAAGHPYGDIAKVTEGDAKPVSEFVFGNIDLELIKYACIVPFTDELEQDGMTGIEQIIRQFASEYFGIKFDNILFNGDSGNITGLSGMSTTGVITGTTAISSVTLDNLILTLGSMRSVDLRSAKWYMHPSTWANLFTKKADPSGQYLLNINEINNKTMLGYPVVLSDFAPAYSGTPSAATKYIYFGNLKKIYVGRKNQMGISVSKEATVVDGETTYHLWQQNMTGVRLEMRVDMDSAFPNRIVDIRTAAE